MNLIDRETKESAVASFRNFQYSLIPDLITEGINYLISLGLEYDPVLYNPDGSSLEIIDDLLYTGLKHYSSKIIKVKVQETGKNEYFLYLSIPELIHGTFFKLNGVHYIPMFYVADEPIIVKEKSILLSSMFQPITLYFGDNRVIFMGANIVLSDFIQLMTHDWSDEAKDAIKNSLGIGYTKKIDELIVNFSEKINCERNLPAIKDKINLLFFDNWTKELYEQFYEIDPNIDNVLKIALHRKIENIRPIFIDLRHKRLVFIEVLLRPFFRTITAVANLLIAGKQPRNLKIHQSMIIKKYFDDLDGNVFYDTTNGFSGILAHKCSFKNPFGTGELPIEVSSIHWTHEGRLCTISITNTNPGQTGFLIPDQQIDPKFGIFQFTEEEMQRE